VGWGEGAGVGSDYLALLRADIEQIENIIKTSGKLRLHRECLHSEINKIQTIRLENVRALVGR
jgi:hypothetical protein